MATLLDELFRYVGFGPDDGARLIAASAALTPAFDSIVDRFYVAIDATPEARAVFKDEAQIARQKQLLRSWLVRFFAGPYDDSYYRGARAHRPCSRPHRAPAALRVRVDEHHPVGADRGRRRRGRERWL
jgi:hypothetical protein